MNELYRHQPELIIVGDETLETLEGIDENREKWQTYSFNGVTVPRMSEILKAIIGRDYLINYALRCRDYYSESSQTLYIGTTVHEMIDRYLTVGEVDLSSFNFMNDDILKKCMKAYTNFTRWYEDKIAEGYSIEVLGIEKEVVCPWYGGTIDCIMKITDANKISKTYIVDFKTSNKISMEYLIQTYGYMWATKWYNTNVVNEYPDIDGIGIIRIDKKYKTYHDLFISSGDLNSIINIHNGFVSALYWFYHQINLDWIVKNFTRK